jgi:hypothetical protein
MARRPLRGKIRQADPTLLTRFPALTVLASIALFVIGGGALVYAFATLAYDVPVGETVAAFALGVVAIASSITLVIATERQLRREEAERARLAPPPATRPKRAAADPNRVLAQWTLAPDEWRAFSQVEAREMRRDLVYNTLVGAVFGVVAVKIFGGRWMYAALAGALLGGAILAASVVSIARVRRRLPAGGGVVIRGNRVEIDGVRSDLVEDGRHLSGARLRKDLRLPVIEITTRKTRYGRNGSRRTMENVLRVPVPRGREDEAGRVAELLRRHVLVDEDDDG